MKRKYLLAGFLFSIAQLYGCASIVSGQDQAVSVTAPNCPDAECELKNSDGTYYVKTPGTVTVGRDYDDLALTCRKEGHDPVVIHVKSSTKGMAFGNIILGGVIGAGVDMATGAAYDYPTEVISPLDCRSKAQIASAPKTGNYDQEALALVDTGHCDVPKFAGLDGVEEIYISNCSDGTVGVISCTGEGCLPANVSVRSESEG
ncbi:Uncharacterised protein [Halioglobus japonicus]|nr:Uncharacterised protein [Halioglobus japonicus]